MANSFNYTQAISISVLNRWQIYSDMKLYNEVRTQNTELFSNVSIFLSDIVQYMQKCGRNDCLLFQINTLKIILTF